MKTLYLDCQMGAAGDMLTAALLELLPHPDEFVDRLNALALPGVEIRREKVIRCGIAGTRMSVKIHGAEEEASTHAHHHHRTMREIEQLIADMRLPQKVESDVLAVYGLIAEAESRAHGVPVTDIHFHEVGTLDAIADITAVCLLMDALAPEQVIASPVHVGSGHVQCAHGILPVPAPATAIILQGVPIYGGEIEGELCTPTGAALLKHFVNRFGDMPQMQAEAVGYGMGTRDFGQLNCVRAMLGETGDSTDVVLELSCNVDDMTAEALGFAMERLFEGGAHEVYTVPIGMKKSRPGTLLRVICREQDRDRLVRLIFRHTTTLGVRETVTRRYILGREIQRIPTPYGEVRRKVSSGYGVTKTKIEHDDLARIANELGLSLDEVKQKLGV